MSNDSKHKWETVFEAKSMAKGMSPDFLHKLLNERPVFARYGKLLTATLWLQSQMIGLIYLYEDPDLRGRCLADNSKGLPYELANATLYALETLSSESLRIRFLKCFGPSMPKELKKDLAVIMLYRDGLCHGYVSLMQQIIGPYKESVLWSPRPTPTRNEVLKGLTGQDRPDNSYFPIELSELKYDEHMKKVCNMMDFIGSQLDKWDIPFPTFA